MTANPFDPAGAGWERAKLSNFVEHLGPVWRRRVETGTLYGLEITDRHANRGSFAHGGAVAALFDTALGYTSLEAIGGRNQATVTLDIQFLAPVPLGSFAVVESTVIRTTRSLTFVHGTLRVGEDIHAVAQGTWKILRA